MKITFTLILKNDCTKCDKHCTTSVQPSNGGVHETKEYNITTEIASARGKMLKRKQAGLHLYAWIKFYNNYSTYTIHSLFLAFWRPYIYMYIFTLYNNSLLETHN